MDSCVIGELLLRDLMVFHKSRGEVFLLMLSANFLQRMRLTDASSVEMSLLREVSWAYSEGLGFGRVLIWVLSVSRWDIRLWMTGE